MPLPRLALARRAAPAAVLAAGALVAGCGSSDDSATTSSAATGTTTTAAATPSTSAAPATAAGSGAVTVDATDFKFSKPTISATAGKVKITLDNQGQAPHEFVVLKTSAKADALPVKGGRVSETGSVGEISETAGGKSATHTFDLKPGTYVYVCNIPGHYQDGMHGTLTVR